MRLVLSCAGWNIKYGRITQYLSQIKETPEVHKKFLKAVAKWIERHNSDPDAARVHCSRDMSEAMTVTSKEVVADRALMKRTFVEKDAYMEGVKEGLYKDPEKHKEVKMVSAWIEEEDATLQGYWIRGFHGNGRQGHYEHESSVGTEVDKAQSHHHGPELVKGLVQEKWKALKGVASEMRVQAAKSMVTAQPSLAVADLLAMAAGAGVAGKGKGGNSGASEELGGEEGTDEGTDSDDEEPAEETAGVFDRHLRRRCSEGREVAGRDIRRQEHS